MKYRRELIDRADEVLLNRRKKAQAYAEQMRAKLYETRPELADAERGQAESLAKAATHLLHGERSMAVAMVDRMQELDAVRKHHLRALGMSEDALDPKYACKHCADTGFVEGLPCDCYRQLLRQLSYEHSPMGSALRDQNFDNFSLHYYSAEKDGRGSSPRSRMAATLQRAKQFAEDFGSEKKSLLLIGGCGLGKTHLSSAVGGAIAERGYYVVYESAGELFSKHEAVRFGRAPDIDTTTYVSCDLLIIDDLGSEHITQLGVATLFSILNTRIIRCLSTILSTNFSLAELEEHYAKKVVSRILGDFEILRFEGTDIRTLRVMEKL